MELIRLYGWAIVGGTLAALMLGLLGCWLAARDRAMQTLCLGQGATLGVLVGLGLVPILGVEGELSHFVPFAVAFTFSFLTYAVSERFVRGRGASKNTLYSFLYGVLLALAYLVSALFPALESHMAQVFFGDLATLNDHDAFKIIALSVAGLGTLSYRWRAFSNQAFEAIILGSERRERVRWGRRLFGMVSFASICFSVQYLGFLFTVACLFVPTSILVLSRLRGLRPHLICSSAIAAVATLLGFALSLEMTRLPTVPTIVILMLALGLTVGALYPRLKPSRA